MKTFTRVNTRQSIVEDVRESEYLMQELQTKRTSCSPRHRFKMQTYLVIIDSHLAELKKRLKAIYMTIFFKNFRFLPQLTSLSNEKIEEKAKNLVSSYPDDLEDTLAAEVIQFLHLCAPRNL